MRVTVQRLAGTGPAVRSSLSVSNVYRAVFRCSSIEKESTLIAPGEYSLKYTRSPRFSRAASIKAGKPVDVFTPQVMDVPGRDGLRIHVANYVRQLEGCIAPGYAFMDMDKDGVIDVKESRLAYDNLVDILFPEGGRDLVHTIKICAPVEKLWS